MSFTDRLSNGWELGMTSLRIIRNNPKLLFFPVFSSIALLMVLASFFGGLTAVWGLDFDAWTGNATEGSMRYVVLFAYYLVNYFVIVFFNVGLVFCARRIFEGKEVTIGEGISFSLSRIGVILQWAVLAATVGVVLNTLQERLGWLGKIVVGLIGMVWSIATYFVVPVLAFEKLQPISAVKRSGAIIKEKWGESLAANFGFFVFYILGYLVIFTGGFLIGFFVHPIAGVALGILAALALHAGISAAQTVFLAAAYQHTQDQPHGEFDGNILDNMFAHK